MSLSPSALQELTAELQSLERKKRDIDDRINAILLLLRKSPSGRRVTADEPQRISTGLREALKTVLTRGPKVPADVIQALRESGFEAAGKTPIQTRVYNELGRMKKDGLVKRDADGRYALAA